MAAREKVCAGCRTGSERAARAAKTASPAPSGLDVFAAAAANQTASPSLAVGSVGGVAVVPSLMRKSGDVSAVLGISVAPRPPFPVVSLSLLMTLLERYDTLTSLELACFENPSFSHLRDTKPNQISFAFKNGVNRRYVVAPTARRAVVGRRQLRRRATHASDVLATLVPGGNRTYQKELKALLSLAQRGKGVSVVPTQGHSLLSAALQARFMTSAQLSGVQWDKLRRALGGKASGLVSRETMRSEQRAMADQPARQVVVDELGARLGSLRGALECLLDELTQSGLFLDRYVRDHDGRPVPHTSNFTGQAGPHSTHSDATADVQPCLGLDKGGRTSSCKLVLTVANQPIPQRRQNSILLATYPCIKDGPEEVVSMIGPWVADLRDLLSNGVTVNGRRRAVRLLMKGDFPFLSTFCGHKGASSHMSFLWCLVVRRPCANSSAEVALYGSMQRVEERPRVLRTLDHSLKMTFDYAAGGNETLPVPHCLGNHLSIERCATFPMPSDALVPIPLHLTLRVPSFLLQLAITAVVVRGGGAVGLVAATAIETALLEDVGVRSVPYHGGGFEGRACHLIAGKATLLCDALAPQLPEADLCVMRDAWASWEFMVGVLNRAEEIPLSDIKTFDLVAVNFVPPLRRAFPWVSVTVKLNSLAHHAPAFLNRYGSLGMYREQALEAWHGHFNQAGAKLIADSFLGRSKALVQQATTGYSPVAGASLNNGQHRRPAAPGARRAVRPCDKRLRSNKTHQRSTTAEDARDQQDMQQWATDRVSTAETSVKQHNRNTGQPGKPNLPSDEPAPSADEDILEEEELDPVALFLLAAPAIIED